MIHSVCCVKNNTIILIIILVCSFAGFSSSDEELMCYECEAINSNCEYGRATCRKGGTENYACQKYVVKNYEGTTIKKYCAIVTEEDEIEMEIGVNNCRMFQMDGDSTTKCACFEDFCNAAVSQYGGKICTKYCILILLFILVWYY